ncbi:MAG: thioesterase [Cyanobacteria bacterium HKST-UBA02]|nr:thioesterase [Cyanobacteria bacterium HKST-UBA02]
MKPGISVGQTAELEVEITADMTAAFEGITVHDLYSTSYLVHHMEFAARKLILDYLEPHEEGMGCHVQVSHLAPTLPGMLVKLRATITDIRDNKIQAEVEASNIRGKIARGEVTQAIIEKEWLEKRMKELSIVQNISSEFPQGQHVEQTV